MLNFASGWSFIIIIIIIIIIILHDTLPVDLPDLWSSDILILAFVVFNPGDLYYLGYKKIIMIIIINRFV